MRFLPVILLVPALALLAPAPAAALYRCTTADGGVSFQQAPCMDGDGVELEAGDAFGVRPPVPRPADDAPASGDEPAGAATAGVTPSGKTIHVGPRGGRYTVSASGRKNYLPALPAGTAPPPASPRQARDVPQIHVGARGGCYTLGSTGRKNYLPRAQCPQE